LLLLVARSSSNSTQPVNDRHFHNDSGELEAGQNIAFASIPDERSESWDFAVKFERRQNVGF
jgi:hypothetical protein